MIYLYNGVHVFKKFWRTNIIFREIEHDCTTVYKMVGYFLI